MYISILDYNRQCVIIINDTEHITAGLQTDDVEEILCAIGFHPSEINFMVSEDDPYESASEYPTLREKLADLSEEELEELQEMVDADWEDMTDGE